MTITYRPSGGRLDLNRPSGAVTNINPDNALRLGDFTQNFAGTANDLTNTFEYNPASQITKLSQSNPLYTYDELGSRAGSYTPNGLNQIASIAGQSLGYDAAGNLTSDAGTGMTYTYDMENRLVATGGVPSTLLYDVLGRLAQITVAGITTQFHYDGDALVGEYVSNAMQRRYVHGDQVDEPLVQYNLTNVGATYRRYLHADHQGSIIAQSDNAGNLLAQNKYDPYGVSGSGNSDRFGYTGQTWISQLGLNYYKARFYSPKLGRFLQTDPIFYKDDMNIYAYVGNDPANHTDSTGQFLETFLDIVDVVRNAGKVIGGVAAYAVGVATGNDNLADAAADGLRESRADMGMAAAAVVIPGVSTGMLRAGEKAIEAGADAAKSLTKFEKKLPAGAGPTTVHDLPSGGKAFQAEVPGRVPGSKAVYEKQIDVNGATTGYTKTTYDPAEHCPCQR